MADRPSAGPSARRAGILRTLAFVLIVNVPLGLLALLTLSLATGAVQDQIDARLRTTAAVSAASVQQEMQGLSELVDSYARRPVLLSLLHGATSSRAPAAMDAQLGSLRTARPGIATTFIADAGGRLLNIVPATPSIIGNNFAYRDWYQGVTRTGQPYVSTVYKSAATGLPRVVAVGAPVRDTSAPGQPVVAILVAAYGTDALQTFVRNVAGAQGAATSITDQHGVDVAAPGSPPQGLVSHANDPSVAAALRGASGVLVDPSPNGDMLVAYAPVRGLGWTVTASVPSGTAFAAIGNLRLTVAGIGAGLALMLSAGLLLLIRSAERRRRAEETRHRLDEQFGAVLRAAVDHCIIGADEHGTVTVFNTGAERMLGYSAGEVVGRASLTDFHEPRELSSRAGELNITPGIDVLVRAAAHGDSETREWTLVRKDGSQVPVSMSVAAMRNSTLRGYIAVSTDIADRRRAERELREAHAKAMESTRLKSEFLANMSHEIRTPMNGVIGMTGLLLDTELSTEQREYARAIRQSGDALLAVVNDILDFSKIESGKLRLETVDFALRSLIEDVAAAAAPAAHAKDLELAVLIDDAVPDTVRGDPSRIRQVLDNLLSNAIKFTAAGEVVVHAGVERAGGTMRLVRFAVSDTGIGLDPAASTRVFESFTQADATTTRQFGGTGLGLAISKQLTELMGGDIGVDSAPGEGSTFWFTVPLTAVPHVPVLTEPPKSLEGVRVLGVDDNATNRTVLTGILTAWGVRCSMVSSGVEALHSLGEAVAEGDPYAVAIIDLQMPGMDGLEVGRRIRASPLLAATSMVVLTSSAHRGHARLAHEAGFDAFLIKPVRPSSLLNTLLTVLNVDERRADLEAGTEETVAVHSSSTRPSRFLVVDDNAVNRTLAVRMLEKLGHTADVAENGAVAVDACTRDHYDAVLMDCQMPVMDGYAATRAIRRLHGSEARIPIIGMTASAMVGDREKCLAAGMDDYVVKPMTLPILTSTLTRWLRGTEPADSPDADADGSAAGHATVLAPDMLDGLRDLGGDAVREVVDLFVRETTARLDALAAAVRRGDRGEIGQVAHSIAGSSANLGGAALAERSRALQTDATAVDADELQRRVLELHALFTATREALAAEFNMAGASRGG